MTSRNAFRLLGCAALLCGAGLVETAHAQGTPFTIRRPPDGSTVREKVDIVIPRNSIGPGGFVAIYLDDKFSIAVPPDEQGLGRPFTFVWDTKASDVSDGPHNVKAVLYEPAGDSAGTAVTERGSTSVRLTVANKIHNGPNVLHLRYKLPAGENLEYSRTSSAKVANSGITFGNTNETVLAQTDSTLLLDIISPTPLALVRNKLTSLSVLMQGQETTLDRSELSSSMYQEVDPLGEIHYETASGTLLDAAMAMGLPVNNNLELPLLPNSAVAIGQTWTTPRQRLDIPGLPVQLQPRVTLRSTLVDLEWEGNRKTAKIHQTLESEGSSPLPGEFEFASVPVTEGQVKYERDIYFDYVFGVLVKTDRTVTITGHTSSQVDQQASGGSSAAGGYPGMGGPGMMSGGRPGMGGPGMMSGGPGMMSGGRPGGYPGMGGGPGMMSGGRPGMGGGPGMMSGGPGMMSGGRPGMGGPGMLGGGRPGGNTGAANQSTDHPVTLKAITDTQLVKVINP